MNISIQPITPADLPQVIRLCQAELPAHQISESEFVRKVLLDENFDPRDALAARDPSGTIAGFVLAVGSKGTQALGPVETNRGWITLFAVRRDLTRRSIGSQLLDAAENWLTYTGKAEAWISPYAPNYWTPGVDESNYPAALEFLKQRGYEVKSRPLGMSLDLTRCVLPNEWATARELELRDEHALQVLPVSPQSIIPLMNLLSVEFAGDWHQQIRKALDQIYSGFRPIDEIQIAIARDEVWGFAHSDGERFGPIGVAECRRGLGVGAVLLNRSLHAMQQRGLARAWFMWTGEELARRLYSPAGFRQSNRYSVLCKKLR